MSRIQVRRDTAAAWTTANPVLLSGEEALETDTRKEKIGDGINAWNALPYRSAGAGGVTAQQLADVKAIADGAAFTANAVNGLFTAGAIAAVVVRTSSAPNPARPTGLPAGSRVLWIGISGVTGDPTNWLSGDLSALV